MFFLNCTKAFDDDNLKNYFEYDESLIDIEKVYDNLAVFIRSKAASILIGNQLSRANSHWIDLTYTLR